MFDTSSSRLQLLPKNDFLGRDVYIKRDDLIDEVVSGNKWRKLKYIVLKAQQEKKTHLLSFGGAYSNHLVALAKAGKLANFKTIGIVRGEELNATSNAVLASCEAWEMELHFVPRETYRSKEDKAFLADLHARFPNTLIIPEGGAGYYGMLGCQEIWKEIEQLQVDYVFLAAGTGTTTAGLLMGAPENTVVCCVPVLAGGFMRKNVEHLLRSAFLDEDSIAEKMNQLLVLDGYHFGKYAASSKALDDFTQAAMKHFNFQLDTIYTGKALYACADYLKKELISKDKTCVFLHTGGYFS